MILCTRNEHCILKVTRHISAQHPNCQLSFLLTTCSALVWHVKWGRRPRSARPNDFDISLLPRDIWPRKFGFNDAKSAWKLTAAPLCRTLAPQGMASPHPLTFSMRGSKRDSSWCWWKKNEKKEKESLHILSQKTQVTEIGSSTVNSDNQICCCSCWSCSQGALASMQEVEGGRWVRLSRCSLIVPADCASLDADGAVSSTMALRRLNLQPVKLLLITYSTSCWTEKRQVKSPRSVKAEQIPYRPNNKASGDFSEWSE